MTSSDSEQLALPPGPESASDLAAVDPEEARFPSGRLLERGHRPDRTKTHAMRAFLKAFEETGRLDRAAKQAGISIGRLHSWREIHPWFDQRIEIVRERIVAKVEDTVIDRALDGTDMATSRWVLERRAPQRWGKSEQKGNGPPLTINIEQNVFDAI